MGSPIVHANVPMGVTPYGFDSNYERAVVYYLASNPKFFGRIGSAIEPDCLADETARSITRAAQSIAHDCGTGPDSTTLILQRMRGWFKEGKILEETVYNAVEYFDAVEADMSKLPSWEKCLPDLIAIIKRRMEWTALQTGLKEYSHRGDTSRVVDIFNKAKRLGTTDDGVGSRIGRASLQGIKVLAEADKVQTGILELDDYLRGGRMRGTLWMWMGRPGSGKSMGLVGDACAAAYQGHLVCAATCELAQSLWEARINAHLTGISIDEILANPMCIEEQIDTITTAPGFGGIIVKAFQSGVSTVEDVFDWTKHCEDMYGCKCSTLVVDYLDKLKSRERIKDRYEELGVISDKLFYYARDGERWSTTATQARRGDKNKKGKSSRLEQEDMGDSDLKSRNTDYLCTINPEDDGYNSLFIAKNRVGPAGKSVGPFPTDFSIARLAPTVFLPPWSGNTPCPQ